MITKRRKSLIDGMLSGSIVVDFLPQHRTNVIVHCEEFSCLAYVDPTGLWRDGMRHGPICSRVLGWEPVV